MKKVLSTVMVIAIALLSISCDQFKSTPAVESTSEAGYNKLVELANKAATGENKLTSILLQTVEAGDYSPSNDVNKAVVYIGTTDGKQNAEHKFTNEKGEWKVETKTEAIDEKAPEQLDLKTFTYAYLSKAIEEGKKMVMEQQKNYEFIELTQLNAYMVDGKLHTTYKITFKDKNETPHMEAGRQIVTNFYEYGFSVDDKGVVTPEE